MNEVDNIAMLLHGLMKQQQEKERPWYELEDLSTETTDLNEETFN